MKLFCSVQQDTGPHCVGDQQDATAVRLAVKPLKMNSLKERLEDERGWTEIMGLGHLTEGHNELVQAEDNKGVKVQREWTTKRITTI